MDWYNSLDSLNLAAKVSDMSWLQDGGSLTKYLKDHHCGQQLTLKLLHQGWCQATDEESMRLGTANKSDILERIVYESSEGIPFVYARSYYSPFAVEYFGNDLLNLGDGFLGELITNKYPELYNTRGSFEFAKLSPNDPQCIVMQHRLNITQHEKLIARRSLFKLENKILFNLEELFFPVLIRQLL